MALFDATVPPSAYARNPVYGGGNLLVNKYGKSTLFGDVLSTALPIVGAGVGALVGGPAGIGIGTELGKLGAQGLAELGTSGSANFRDSADNAQATKGRYMGLSAVGGAAASLASPLLGGLKGGGGAATPEPGITPNLPTPKLINPISSIITPQTNPLPPVPSMWPPVTADRDEVSTGNVPLLPPYAIEQPIAYPSILPPVPQIKAAQALPRGGALQPWSEQAQSASLFGTVYKPKASSFFKPFNGGGAVVPYHYGSVKGAAPRPQAYTLYEPDDPTEDLPILTPDGEPYGAMRIGEYVINQYRSLVAGDIMRQTLPQTEKINALGHLLHEQLTQAPIPDPNSMEPVQFKEGGSVTLTEQLNRYRRSPYYARRQGRKTPAEAEPVVNGMPGGNIASDRLAERRRQRRANTQPAPERTVNALPGGNIVADRLAERRNQRRNRLDRPGRYTFTPEDREVINTITRHSEILTPTADRRADRRARLDEPAHNRFTPEDREVVNTVTRHSEIPDRATSAKPTVTGSTAIMRLQRQLREQGFVGEDGKPLKVDGIRGPQTRFAEAAQQAAASRETPPPAVPLAYTPDSTPQRATPISTVAPAPLPALPTIPAEASTNYAAAAPAETPRTASRRRELRQQYRRFQSGGPVIQTTTAVGATLRKRQQAALSKLDRYEQDLEKNIAAGTIPNNMDVAESRRMVANLRKQVSGAYSSAAPGVPHPRYGTPGAPQPEQYNTNALIDAENRIASVIDRGKYMRTAASKKINADARALGLDLYGRSKTDPKFGVLTGISSTNPAQLKVKYDPSSGYYVPDGPPGATPAKPATTLPAKSTSAPSSSGSMSSRRTAARTSTKTPTPPATVAKIPTPSPLKPILSITPPPIKTTLPQVPTSWPLPTTPDKNVTTPSVPPQTATNWQQGLTDVGRLAAGVALAAKPVDRPTIPASWQAVSDEATAQKEQGLSAVEQATAQAGITNGYRQGVSALAGLTGGGSSSSTVLGGLAQLNANRLNAEQNLLLRDEARRQQNRARFGAVSAQTAQMEAGIQQDGINRQTAAQNAGQQLIGQTLANVENRQIMQRNQPLYDAILTEQLRSQQEAADADRAMREYYKAKASGLS